MSPKNLDFPSGLSTGKANIFYVPGTNESYQTDYASGGRVGACVFSVNVETWFNPRRQFSQNWKGIDNLEFREREAEVYPIYTPRK